MVKYIHGMYLMIQIMMKNEDSHEKHWDQNASTKIHTDEITKAIMEYGCI